MLKMIIIPVIGAIVFVLLYAATRENTFLVKRTVTINAAPDRVFPYLNDFHHWSAWSPYESRDRNMKHTLSGAPQGTGAVLEWEGNKKAGRGRMEITESIPSKRIVIKLDISEPFEAHNTAEYALVAKGTVTEVSWAMSGPNAYVGKLMQVLGIMDRLIGKEFDEGLANLKAIVER
jgi:uncharacterized protein YndB with AHSA1/START domain